jgi:phage terminase large subunit
LSILRIEVPRAFQPFLANARYKAAWGGRGGGKSHFFAGDLVRRCYSEPTRAVCIREVQNSLKESVRQLVVDKIQAYGLGQSFDILEAEIRGPNNSLIIFRGMQSYNAESIKSLEGYDVAFVEEAQTFSQKSLDLLRPTIRKEGSELWFVWNPRHDTDPVDAFFRKAGAPPNSVVRKINWEDNPWFPDVLRAELEHDRAVDEDKYTHVWDGGYEIISEGAYYAKSLAEAEKDGRIGDFPYDPALPVLTAWDIGVDDYTAIWFMQENGRQVRAIDYFEASGEGAEQIVRAALPELIPDATQRADGLQALGRKVPYRYGHHFLPHDVMVREWGAGAKTRFETLTGLGVKPIRVGAAMDPADRVNAGRGLFPVVRFNAKTTAIGRTRLQKYRRRLNETLGVYMGPLHDENSHGSDAFGEFAVNCAIRPKASEMKKPTPTQQTMTLNDVWESHSVKRDERI